MTKLCEGRVAIITGAGRGIGREHALLLAHHGAKVVVNDLGGSMDGEGNDQGPAQDVVDEIVAMGGEAIANSDDISDWDGAERFVQTAIDTFGGLDIVINNAGILRDRMLTNMTEAEWDAVIKVHLKGTFAPCPPRRRLLAGAVQGRRDERRPHHQHHRRRRASTATSARPTTAPPRPASPASRSSPPRSSAATASPSTPSPRPPSPA